MDDNQYQHLDECLHIVQLVNLTDEWITLQTRYYVRRIPDLPPRRTTNVHLFFIMEISEFLHTRNWRIEVLKAGNHTGTHIIGGHLEYFPQITFKYTSVGKFNNVFCIQGTRRKPSDECIRISCCGGLLNKFLNKRRVSLIDWNHPQKATMLRSPDIQHNLWGIGARTPADCKDARDEELRSEKVKLGQIVPIYSRFGN